jgi:hypothetical protein
MIKDEHANAISIRSGLKKISIRIIKFNDDICENKLKYKEVIVH